MDDVVIVGGGVMGVSCARRLAKRGAAVTVLERSVPGAEASSAAAGIIGAQFEAKQNGPTLELNLASRKLFPKLARDLHRETGIDAEFRPDGILDVAFDAAGARQLVSSRRWQVDAGLDVEKAGKRRCHELEPALNPAASGAFFPNDGRVDPARLFRALHISAARAGARFRSGAYVQRVEADRGRAVGVRLDDGTLIRAGHVVVAAGSWTSLVGMPAHVKVRPARGQIVELRCREPVLSRLVHGPRCYVVPRDDGSALVGSTLEFVGFRREVTAGAVRDLLDAAIELVPAFGDAELGRTWSSFRPHTDDGRPLIGPSTISGLTLASGHYRTGILLAPITAEVVDALVRGKAPPVEVDAFEPGRPPAG